METISHSPVVPPSGGSLEIGNPLSEIANYSS